jgi:hypothetical protein
MAFEHAVSKNYVNTFLMFHLMHTIIKITQC